MKKVVLLSVFLIKAWFPFTADADQYSIELPHDEMIVEQQIEQPADDTPSDMMWEVPDDELSD